MSKPESSITICSGVRLNNKYEHTILFDTPEKQKAFFYGQRECTLSGYTYLRKHWDIKVTYDYATLAKCNYLYFNNPGDPKTYYYFINDVEYVSPTCANLKLEMDVMQTNLFDMWLQPCFVERAHSTTDEIGENLLEEGLEIGDLKTVYSAEVNLTEMCILVMSSLDLNTVTKDSDPHSMGRKYNGGFSGLTISAVDINNYGELGYKLSQLDEWGKSDCVVSIWLYPKRLVKLGDSWTDDRIFHIVTACDELFYETDRNTTLADGYTPKNNKLFTHI